MHSHIFLICWLGVSVALVLLTLCHTVSLTLPLSLTVGPPACFIVSRKRVKPVLSFPALHSKLSGGENRLRCHPPPNLSPRRSGKQTVELPDRSGGDMRTCGVFEQSPRREMNGCSSKLSPVMSFICHFLQPLPCCQTYSAVSLSP